MLYTPLTFFKILSEITKELDITHTTYSDNWIHELSKGGRHVYIVALRFPLNMESSAALARDKTASYSLLRQHNVPVVPHTLISLPVKYVEGSYLSVVSKAESEYGYPMVVKPNNGLGGKDVMLASNRDELIMGIEHIHKSESACISPFVSSEVEYRVVVLKGKVLIIIGKKPLPPEWRHNMSYGALPILDIAEPLRQQLSDIACRAAQVMDLAMAAVDIFCDTNGILRILEVNSSVSLLTFSKRSKEHYALAKGVYTELVRASLNL